MSSRSTRPDRPIRRVPDPTAGVGTGRTSGDSSVVRCGIFAIRAEVASGVRIGISYNTAFHGLDPERILAIARHAELCGFESFSLPEHIAFYPGASLSGIEVDPTTAVADPLECLSFVAAGTERLLLGTGVLLVPYHHPVLLAKRLATIDVLSGGRMRLLTIGLGSLRGEAEAFGVDFDRRGRYADEAIDVLRLLWSGDETGVDFDGEMYAFTNLCSYPKPYDARPLPIHVGGSSRAAARRAGLRGDGYFPGGMLPPAERLAQLEVMRTAAREAGRDPAELAYTRWGSPTMDAESVRKRAEQGITRLVVPVSAVDLDDQRAELSALAERVGLDAPS